ncbi:MAG: nucleoside triphosphate pyrophosphohydrolase [Hyphomicrobiaceae bacterium]
MTEEPLKTLDDLVAVMAALRTPGTGCPWDLEQTFESIAPYTIEEAYEVADAIAKADLGHLKEELGDLLLQVVYHARMAEEAQAFALPDVVDAITRKMIRRHPHVFGDEAARSAPVAKGFWERIKAEERRRKGSSHGPASMLADVPIGLPALTRAVKLQGKAAKAGFDWPSLGPVFDKLREEMTELEAVAVPADPRGASGDPPTAPPDAVAEELGDMLFVVANVARHLELDPEDCLRRANAKFERRFAHIERRLAESGRTAEQSDLAEMDRYWDEAKALERREQDG